MVAYDTDVSGTVQPTGAANNDESYEDAIAVLLTAMGGDAPAATTPLLWAGQYQDPTTGLYYMRARWYDPNTGEFLCVDPEFDQTLDAYRYADEDPVMQADPSGLMIQVAVAGEPTEQRRAASAIAIAKHFGGAGHGPFLPTGRKQRRSRQKLPPQMCRLLPAFTWR